MNMNRLRLRAEGGFTLIELLVVIAIIGILAAIAIPQFAAYRRRGYGSQVKSDLRVAATAEEAYYLNANTYLAKSSALTSTDLPGFNKSADVTVLAGASETTFVLTATHSKCNSADLWTYASTSGLFGNNGGCDP
ncbi:MAG: prepilin-type N-terminal cleavage/methylation domain-containing protein [Candidatus Binatia bacterium]